MRRRGIGLVMLAAISLTGCDQVRDTVEQATDQAQEAVGDLADTAEFCLRAVEVARAVDDRDVDAAVSAGEALVAVAPDDIRADAQLVLDAAREAQGGNFAALQSDEVQAAAQRLRTATEDTCNPTS